MVDAVEQDEEVGAPPITEELARAEDGKPVKGELKRKVRLGAQLPLTEFPPPEHP